MSLQKLTLGDLRQLTTSLPDETPIQPDWFGGPPQDHEPGVMFKGLQIIEEDGKPRVSIAVALFYPDDMSVCDECGAIIPDSEGGGVMNKHHDESCSAYDPDLE